jgi:hypothetical protein
LGITIEGTDPETGNETWEAVNVVESLEFVHPRIVTGSSKGGKADFHENSRRNGGSIM